MMGPHESCDEETPMRRVALVTFVTVVVAGVFSVIVVGVSAQQAGFKRTLLQQGKLSVPGREVVQAIAEFQPGGTVGPHTHPGEEIGYVLDGTIVLEQEGKPTVTLGAGKTFLIPPGTVHNATNKSSSPARVLATYIVEEGKPLATPVAGR
jgi:quercetin dioxygenase-like cupin family protein